MRPFDKQRMAFTLIELMITITIISVMLSVVTVSFRKLSETSALTTALDTLTTYAAVARAYAVDHGIEAMLVVNPHNGRLEIWHANPPPLGGPWDPLSGGDGTVPTDTNTNGYAFASVLDTSATLPIGADGRPLVVVHPVDFNALFKGNNPNDETSRVRPRIASQQNWDNLNWVAVCFDPDGRLVSRIRRIATRMALRYDGTNTPLPNRRADGTPDIGNASPRYVVDRNDSILTSTRGFIVSDRLKYEGVVGSQTPLPFETVVQWLDETPGSGLGARFHTFKRQTVVNPWSGRELAPIE